MSKKILLIDDDQITNFFNKKVIEQIGNSYDIKSFTSVSEAINFLKLNKHVWFPNIILLDIFMPIKNGWDFLEEFHHEFGDLSQVIKLYMLSSSVYSEDVVRAKNHILVKDYIYKPLSKDIMGSLLD
jgi:response regulator of citrate/malate metabolism